MCPGLCPNLLQMGGCDALSEQWAKGKPGGMCNGVESTQELPSGNLGHLKDVATILPGMELD